MPEGLKEHSPEDLGRLLGLDRAPEVKTLRRKLARLAACGRAADFGRALAERRVQSVALADLSRRLNASPSVFPGTKLRLRFEVNPQPPESLAFPGSRSRRT